MPDSDNVDYDDEDGTLDGNITLTTNIALVKTTTLVKTATPAKKAALKVTIAYRTRRLCIAYIIKYGHAAPSVMHTYNTVIEHLLS